MKRKQFKRITALLIVAFFLLQPILAEASNSTQELSSYSNSMCDGSGVRIALIDTGVSCKYIDASHVLPGKNYVFPKKSKDDLIGHGTAIAGIILGSNALGLCGVAPGAELVPLVYYSRYASGVPINGGTEAICSAIYDAIDKYNCRIINISSGITDDNDKLKDAIAYAEEKNALVVSSVGNTNLSSPGDIYYPAAYETVVGVGAADEKNEVADFSQRNKSVKLLAPGTNIATVPLGNSSKAVTVKGSSYAAAFVSGAAALLLEDSPELSAAQLREILYASAQNLGTEGYDTESGWGLLDISKALSYEAPLNGPATQEYSLVAPSPHLTLRRS